MTLSVVDLREVPDDERDLAAQKLARMEAETPFDHQATPAR
jgi:hypothetical protein